MTNRLCGSARWRCWQLIVSLIALNFAACVHHQERKQTVSGEPTAAKALGSLGSSAQAPPKGCASVCASDLWECHCAFEIKAGAEPACVHEFEADHQTRCDEESLDQCLSVVVARATERYDRELVDATNLALQCVRSNPAK